METSHQSAFEKRRAERLQLQISATYEWSGITCPCQIIDISSVGIGMRVKGILEIGDQVVVILGKHFLNSKVVRVDGNIIGVAFEAITPEQLEDIISLRNR